MQFQFCPLQDVDFHPTEPLLATSLITGHLYIHNYTKEATEQKHSLVAHDQEAPCRAVCFTLDGKMAVTGSLDKSILAVDVSTGKARARKRDAHDAGITRLLSVSNTGIASGMSSFTAPRTNHHISISFSNNKKMLNNISFLHFLCYR